MLNSLEEAKLRFITIVHMEFYSAVATKMDFIWE